MENIIISKKDLYKELKKHNVFYSSLKHLNTESDNAKTGVVIQVKFNGIAYDEKYDLLTFEQRVNTQDCGFNTLTICDDIMSVEKNIQGEQIDYNIKLKHSDNYVHVSCFTPTFEQTIKNFCH